MAAKNATKTDSTPAPEKPRRGRRKKISKYNRILIGVRVEEHVAKLLRAIAIMLGLPTGEFIEQLLLAAIEGENAFADSKGRIPPATKAKLDSLKHAYDISFTRQELLEERKAAPEKLMAD
jgi:hypothetical protein